MDDATLARLRRAAGWRHTGRNDLLAPRVVRRGDLQEALSELERLHAVADGTAFDVDDYDTTTPEGTQALIDRQRERLRAQGLGGRA